MSIPVAALYRVSTVKQVKKDEEESIPVQAAVVKRYIAEHPEWSLVREYTEEGVSAFKRSSEDRDILQQALADAKNGVYQILLVFKADRLSRNSFEYPVMLWRLHQAGVSVVSVADGGKELKVEEQADKLIRFIEGWQAETESKNTSVRVAHAMREHAKEGRWSGGTPPYGFRLSDSKKGLPLVIDDHEASVIKEMVRLYLEEDMGGLRIATVLNNRNLLTRKRKLWRDQRVRSVLQNPIIAGLPAYGRTRPGSTPNSRIRIRGYTDLNNFIVPRDEQGNPQPIPEYSIIPLETWLRLMRKMQANDTRTTTNEKSPQAMKSTSLLTGFAVCGYCGGTFVSSGSNKHHKNGKVYPYKSKKYRCATKYRVGGGRKLCSGQGNYSQKKVDAALLKEIEGFLSNISPERLTEFIGHQQEAHAFETSKTRMLLTAELKKSRKIYNGWLKRWDEFIADPEACIYPEDVLVDKVKEYKGLISNLEAQLAELTAKAEVEKHRRESLMDFSKHAPKWFELFRNAPVETKKKMLGQIIEKVVLYRDKIQIFYHVDIAKFLGAEDQPPSPAIKLVVSASM